MKTSFAAACLVLVAGLAGCAKPQPEFDFTEFNKTPPRSILVVPIANKSLDVDAPTYLLSTLTVPLAELGYYVFPVNTVKIVLEQEGLYEPEQVRKMEPARLAALFGADAVLYITINRWDAQYVVLSTTVTVEMDYAMTNRDGAPIWKATKRMVYTPQSQQNQGLVGMLVNAAMARAVPNYMPLARQANTQVFVVEPTRLPAGPYSGPAAAK
jgi:hypothetical protein